MRTERGRLGLRARVTLAFATVALGVSATLAALTYGVAHHYLVAQRESTARGQAFLDAHLVKSALEGPSPDVAAALASLQSSNSQSFVYRQNRWFSTKSGAGTNALPASLRAAVLSGQPAEQRFIGAGVSSFAVGFPVPSIRGDFFELFSFEELRRTLAILAVILVAGAVATTVAGGVVGRWASTRLVRPLRQVAAVAEDVAGGALDRRLGTARDRDLLPLVTAFNRMVDALSSRIERDARFASDVSHELRSPLTAMSAAVELVASYRDDLPDPGRRGVDLLSGQVSHFSNLVQDLLELARMDAGRPDAEDDEEVNFAELVTHAVRAVDGDQPPVTVAPGAETLTVRASKRRLERVIANLLDNARQHGGGAVAVVVSEADGFAQLAVDDAGPGVPDEERRLVFERFFRGATAGRRGSANGGAGLGLALVADHVRRHGGTVEALSRPEGGARFLVRLPLVAERARRG